MAARAATVPAKPTRVAAWLKAGFRPADRRQQVGHEAPGLVDLLPGSVGPTSGTAR